MRGFLNRAHYRLNFNSYEIENRSSQRTVLLCTPYMSLIVQLYATYSITIESTFIKAVLG